ncbi:MAG: tRNA (adenosine(37)-N6)-threonylcarbamoyltransferase complex dimerization subunit type 1 TsaB [Rickettsia sp.]|nr:tRNA (adenosine(37)-N6)-threonylcarbamoyltransferase complex dimerization subunit type 1 TsaB [Rickettsia sp.]
MAIDVTNANISVAISKEGKIISYQEALNSRDQSKFLPHFVNQSLENAKIEFDDLNYLIVTSGPGGFTGLRVGLAFAHSLSVVKPQIKIYAVSNFEVYAFRASQQIKIFHQNIVILQAFRKAFAIKIFSKSIDEPFKIIYETQLQEFFQSLISQNPNFIRIVSGNAMKKSWDIICDIKSLIFLPRFPFIRASYVCKLAEKKILQKAKFLNLDPIYCKLPNL